MKNKTGIFNSDICNDYNELITSVTSDLLENFGALASPTLSKQETVTGLFKRVNEGFQENVISPPIPWTRLFKFIPRILLKFFLVIYASSRFKVRSLPSNAVVIKTWLVPRSFSGYGVRDDYFQDLPNDLAAYENVISCFTSSNLKMLNSFANANHRRNQIISYGLLDLKDVLRLFLSYIFTAWVRLPKNYFLGDKNITSYIRNSLLLDYVDLRSFDAYAEKYICQKFAQHKISAFVYVYENQAWEKVCCMVLRAYGIKLIAYQSSGFSSVFLNFFPTEGDAKQNPNPDIILTPGLNFSEYLSNNGSYAVPLEPFAALRFPYPNDGGRYIVTPPNRDIIGRVLYAFSVHIEQYSDIIFDLVEVFSGSGITVDLKFHPLYKFNQIKGINKLPRGFELASGGAADNLHERYDCVIFNDNSFGIESLLQGVKSFQYSRDGIFDDDRFINFDLWNVKLNIADLHLLKVSLKNNTYDKNFNISEVSDYINNMYIPYSYRSLVRFRSILNQS
jgi:hypothetical protein